MNKYQNKLQFLKELKRDLEDYENELVSDLDILERTMKDITLDRRNIGDAKKRIEVEEKELQVMEFEDEK